jgi:hypothetical protein
VTGGDAVGHEEPAAAPGQESAPEFPGFPGRRGAETAAAQRVPAQRPDADADAGTAAGADTEAGIAADVPAARAAGPQDPPTHAAGPAVPAQPTAAPGLGARERAVLAFERRRWKHVGAKEQAIRDEFGLSPTNYYQILNALLDDPAALAHSPALVNRLRRARDARRRERG